MPSLHKFKALVTGRHLEQTDQNAHWSSLHDCSVPVASPDTECRECADPCDEEHEEWPAKFEVDMESEMLGSVKPYHKQLVISTGKADWTRDISDAKGTLAAYFQDILNSSQRKSSEHNSIKVPGVFASADSSRILILNGSHHSVSDSHDQETILVFPDYTLVANVSHAHESAQQFFDHVNSAGTSLSSPFHSWLIPYSCVILLCSHKRRDNRCHIAAEKLEHLFRDTLVHRGWHVDTDLELPIDSPLEEFVGTEIEQQQYIKEHLQSLHQEKRALIIKNSHVGGHRYAGNCIIYTPAGAGVWYGRVSTHEVESIVVNTLEEGRVLPPLLRGGLNISRPACRSLYDW